MVLAVSGEGPQAWPPSGENTLNAELDRIAGIDARLVAAARSIKILSCLEWPDGSRERFLDSWHAGDPRLPDIEYPRLDYSVEKAELEAIVRDAGEDHPLAAYVSRTAISYLTAARMLESLGTPAFRELSRELYGSPADPIGATSITHAEVARQFLATTDPLQAFSRPSEEDYCILPEAVAARMREEARLFTDHPVEITLDPSLSSKAAAGARRVRLRSATCFSPRDLPQLVQHELFVHTLTMLNGREQPRLGSLGLGSPRTTRTQEGIAVFSEVVTGSLDLSRLRRLALRVVAIEMALDGADFLEVFRRFLDAGQVETESYESAYRVFRGGDVRGGTAFSKDGIYLSGLNAVHRFLRRAIQEQHIGYVDLLLTGRMALEDIPVLAPLLESGFLVPPRYRPAWTEKLGCLATFLLYTNVIEGFDLADPPLPPADPAAGAP